MYVHVFTFHISNMLCLLLLYIDLVFHCLLQDQSVNADDEEVDSVDNTTDAVPRSSSAQSNKPNQCSSYLFNISPTDIKVQSYPTALHVRYRPAKHHIAPKIMEMIQKLDSVSIAIQSNLFIKHITCTPNCKGVHKMRRD